MNKLVKKLMGLVTLCCLLVIVCIPGNVQAVRAPFEAGLHIKETYLTFNEKLILRPVTDAIVIHHVARPAGDVDTYYIHRFHQSKGWAGVGYQYVIRKDGTIERGRPFDMVGAQSYGNNYHSLGICVVGNLDVEEPTPEQVKSLTRLVTALCRYYDLTPSTTTIVGHRDYNATDCPGANMYILLPQIRKDVQAELDKNRDTAPIITNKKKIKKNKQKKKGVPSPAVNKKVTPTSDTTISNSEKIDGITVVDETHKEELWQKF